MKLKSIWTVFLICLAVVVFWFSIDLSVKIYRWARQSAQAKPVSMEWEIEKQASDRYVLKANYQFVHQGKKVEGSTLFQSARYKNPQTAQYFQNAFAEKNWNVHYSPSRPEHSTISRFFPLKTSIYTVILWGILIYFILLGYYVGKYRQ